MSRDTYIFSLFFCIKIISAWAFLMRLVPTVDNAQEMESFLHFYGTLLRVPTQTLVLAGRQQEWTTMIR